jgi:acetolactate decarboxylase
VSELEFLGALHVELLRHRELQPDHHEHELFQTSTVAALLAGAFDGDVTLAEVLEHGDLGLGTLNGLDGELIVLDGQAWQATLDGTLRRPPPSAATPYAVVVPFSPGPAVALEGPVREADLDGLLRLRDLARDGIARPLAVRIEGRFAQAHVRSVPKQTPPYPPLAEVIAKQRVTELRDVTATIVGFSFPSALDGIEMTGWHLHLVTADRARGGHVLSFTLHDGTARVDNMTTLHVELPPAVDVPRHGSAVDEALLRRLETD